MTPMLCSQAIRQDLLLDLRAQHRIRRLKIGRRLDARNTLQLRDVEVRHADEGDFPFVPQLRQRRPGFFDGAGIVPFGARRPHGPVNLIQVDALRLQPPQALLDFLANRWRAQAVRRIARVVPHETALGEHVRALDSRGTSCSARPTTSSECPRPYIAAVSNPVQTDARQRAESSQSNRHRPDAPSRTAIRRR